MRNPISPLLAAVLVVSCTATLAPTLSPADIVGVTAESQVGNSQTNLPITFGQAFGVGDVPPGTVIGARLADGTVLDLQSDIKATHADGSVRHAVLTTVLPSLGGNARQQLILTETGSAPGGSTLSLSALLATSYDVTVTADVGGTSYTASARDMLENLSADVWLTGPLVGEWMVSAPLVTSGGSEHPHLSARFYVRAYAGFQNVRTSVVLENTWSNQASPRNYTYDVTVNVAGQGATLTENGVNHYRLARWRRVFWWGTEPNAEVLHDADYLAEIGVVPTYDPTLVVPNSELNSMVSRFNNNNDLMDIGYVDAYMPAGGGRPEIAPLPRFTARYLVSEDARPKYVMMGHAEQAGAWSTHFRDVNTGLPTSLDDYPNLSTCDCNTPYEPDGAHQASFAYVPYLVSGDYYFLEELQFWANWNLFYWGNNGGSLGLVVQDQVRAQAWGLRTLGHAAFATPDGHPMKGYFIEKLNNNLAWYDQRYSNNPPTPLGYILNPPELNLDNTFSTWMDDFFTWTIGHLVQLGFSQAQPLFDYKSVFPVGRMVSPDYCWIFASTYWTSARDNNGNPYQTWDDYRIGVIRSWDNDSFGSPPDFPPNMSGDQEDALIASECNSAEMASILGFSRNQMLGYAWLSEGYPANLQPALAISAELGVPQADQAWSVFDSRGTKPETYDVDPQWAIVPGAIAGPGLTLTADPLEVTSGGSSTLSWSTNGADSCTASASWSGSRPVSGMESVGPISADSDFALSCANADGTTARSVRIRLAPSGSPALSFSASPNNVNTGDSTTLSWTASDVDTCTASGGWSGDKPISGNETISSITSDSTFTLSCSGPAGSVQRSASVTVSSPPPPPPPDPAPTVSLSASPNSVQDQENTTLTWSSTDANSCSASGAWSGSRATSGNESVGPLSADATFTLTCNGAGGSNASSVTVTVTAGGGGSGGGGGGGGGEEAPPTDESTGAMGLVWLVLWMLVAIRRRHLLCR